MTTRSGQPSIEPTLMLAVGVVLGAVAAIVGGYFERMRAERDPVLRAASQVPIDDEPTTAEDLAAIEEGRAALARGEGISVAQWRRERHEREMQKASAV
jgi:hypothetical protein